MKDRRREIDHPDVLRRCSRSSSPAEACSPTRGKGEPCPGWRYKGHRPQARAPACSNSRQAHDRGQRSTSLLVEAWPAPVTPNKSPRASVLDKPPCMKNPPINHGQGARPQAQGQARRWSSPSSCRCRTSLRPSTTWRAKSERALRTPQVHGHRHLLYSGFDEYDDRRLMYTSLADTPGARRPAAIPGDGRRAQGPGRRPPRGGRIAKNPREGGSAARPIQVQDWYELNHKPVHGLESSRKLALVVIP